MSAGLLSKRLYSTRDYNGKFTGNASLVFDGSGDYLNIASNAAFKFGAPSGSTNDFTAEFWAYPTTTGITQPFGTTYSGSNYWAFTLNKTANGNTNSVGRVVFFMTDTFVLESAAGTLAANAWSHIAVTRSGTTVSLYVNGTRVASGTSSVDPNPTGDLLIGKDTVLGRDYTGNLSNLRIVKGTASYTGSSFTVPTSPLTAITNTTVLIGQSPNPLLDVSTNAFTATVNGNAADSTMTPFS